MGVDITQGSDSQVKKESFSRISELRSKSDCAGFEVVSGKSFQVFSVSTCEMKIMILTPHPSQSCL